MATDGRRDWKRDEYDGESKVLVYILTLRFVWAAFLLGPSVLCRVLARLLTIRVHDQM